MNFELTLFIALFLMVFGVVLAYAAGHDDNPIFIAPAVGLIFAGIVLVYLLVKEIK